jgi:crotonobetainyl-CoA:carnitine CoA-transferase CaiB-like acyl-CoA transferase
LKSSQLGMRASSQSAMIPRCRLPLEGMRVVDVTTSIAGPYCAEILAALGADVVKVERPDTGDDGARGAAVLERRERDVPRGERRQALARVSLRDERGREAVLRLADRADVFLQSLRPGLAERLGLGAEALRARNPRLVYCSVGAYGTRARSPTSPATTRSCRPPVASSA